MRRDWSHRITWTYGTTEGRHDPAKIAARCTCGLWRVLVTDYDLGWPAILGPVYKLHRMHRRAVRRNKRSDMWT